MAHFGGGSIVNPTSSGKISTTVTTDITLTTAVAESTTEVSGTPAEASESSSSSTTTSARARSTTTLYTSITKSRTTQTVPPTPTSTINNSQPTTPSTLTKTTSTALSPTTLPQSQPSPPSNHPLTPTIIPLAILATPIIAMILLFLLRMFSPRWYDKTAPYCPLRRTWAALPKWKDIRDKNRGIRARSKSSGSSSNTDEKVVAAIRQVHRDGAGKDGYDDGRELPVYYNFDEMPERSSVLRTLGNVVLRPWSWVRGRFGHRRTGASVEHNNNNNGRYDTSQRYPIKHIEKYIDNDTTTNSTDYFSSTKYMSGSSQYTEDLDLDRGCFDNGGGCGGSKNHSHPYDVGNPFHDSNTTTLNASSSTKVATGDGGVHVTYV